MDPAESVIGAAIEVHRELGPGLLESVYEAALRQELRARSVAFEAQVERPVVYKGTVLPQAYRIDLIVEQQLIVELKAVEAITAVHVAQVLTYLRLSKLRTGLLLNFNVPALRSGIKRVSL